MNYYEKLKIGLFSIGLVIATNGYSQTRLGILVGGLNARHTDEVTYFRKSSDVGWQGGLLLRYDFAKVPISVEMDFLFFNYENHNVGDGNYEITYIDEFGIKQRGGGSNDVFIKNKGITIPLLIKYNMKRFHPYVGFMYERNNTKSPDRYYGGIIAFVDQMGNTQTYGDKIYAIPSNQDYGFLAGLEFDVTQSLGVRFTYSKGMNEVLRYDFTTGILNGEGGTKFSESTRKETFSLNVVYTPQWRKLHFKKGTEPKEKVPLKERMKELY
jgi:hypothetical protein